MRRGSPERIAVGGMTLAIVLALAGWGAGQVGYEPPAAVDGLEPPSLGMAKAFAEVCEPAAPLLLSMAVVVALVTWSRLIWSRFALAVGPRRAAASVRPAPAAPVVPESAEVRAHADRQAPGPGR